MSTILQARVSGPRESRRLIPEHTPRLRYAGVSAPEAKPS
jgi:hypothetical protein